jgi:phytoene desaturase
MYRLKFKDRTVTPTSDHAKMKEEIRRQFPGNENGLDRFLARERVRFERMYPCLQMPYGSYLKAVHPNLLRAYPVLGLGRSLYDTLSDSFDDELLRLSFTFQSKYLGMSPWECPAAFTIIPYVEHQYGIYHVLGGLNMISRGMEKVVREKGGDIRLGAAVKRLVLDGNAVKGVELASGETVEADEVIINADFAHAMSHLADQAVLSKYTEQKLRRKAFSCSTFMLYLGVRKLYDMPHHNVFFSDDYRAYVDDIFVTKRLNSDISFYVQNASVTDPGLAPAGRSTVYVLVPVPNNSSGIDWKKEMPAFRENIYRKIAERTEMKDLRENIEIERVHTPDTWQQDYNVFYGATFNLAHSINQMLFCRPRNKFEELENCYLVGGGTHPGSGLPTIYESARISSNLISRKYGLPFTPPSGRPPDA